jgi:mannose/fructose-specific phosphotransferase system component IIA
MIATIKQAIEVIQNNPKKVVFVNFKETENAVDHLSQYFDFDKEIDLTEEYSEIIILIDK